MPLVEPVATATLPDGSNNDIAVGPRSPDCDRWPLRARSISSPCVSFARNHEFSQRAMTIARLITGLWEKIVRVSDKTCAERQNAFGSAITVRFHLRLSPRGT